MLARRKMGVSRPLLSTVAVTLVAALVAGSGVAPAATTQPTTESYQALLGQVNANQVRSAVINRKAHIVKVTLDDGSVQRIDYPPRQEKALSKSLRQHGATVKIAKRKKAKKAVHHKLRYIAAGVVALGVVVGGVLLILRGRRPPGPSVYEREEAAAAPPPPGPHDEAPPA